MSKYRNFRSIFDPKYAGFVMEILVFPASKCFVTKYEIDREGIAAYSCFQ